jgi:CRISPR-associated protein Cas1
MVQPGDFTHDATSCRLSDTGRRTFLEQFERKLEADLTHPVLQERVTHRRSIELQARVLAKFLTGELPVYVSFSKR